MKYKICPCCKNNKPLTEWGNCKSRKDGLYFICKKCANTKTLKWKKENKEKNRELSRNWYKNNLEKAREINRISGKKWRKNHPDKKRQYCRDRRALIAKTEGKFTKKEWESLKKKCDYCCVLCGLREPEIKLVTDHIIPLSKGGTNYITNIQPLCGSCNSSKGNKI